MRNQRATRSTYAANVGIHKASEKAGDGKALPIEQQVLCLLPLLLPLLLLLLQSPVLALLVVLLLLHWQRGWFCVAAAWAAALCAAAADAVWTFVSNVLKGLLQTQQGPSLMDLSGKIDDLLLKLQQGGLSAGASEKVVALCGALQAADSVQAHRLHAELSATEWHASNRPWLMALKRLLPRPS
ncbi:hypothetical protein Efla_006507 [Eimeria flavescens]